MPTDDDYERDPEVMEAVMQLSISQLGKALDGARDPNDPTYHKVRAAAVEICRQAGILDILRAVSADGVLRPPPPWPAADIVPVGGAVGWLTVAIRTAYKGAVAQCEERIKIKGKPTKDQLGNAYDRGYWRLKRAIKNQERGK
jgi:hypothetical protein